MIVEKLFDKIKDKVELLKLRLKGRKIDLRIVPPPSYHIDEDGEKVIQTYF